MASARKAKLSSIHETEIKSVLNRLHSGSRFIVYTESRGKLTDEDHAYNVLRNLSHPDEIHDEIGRALAILYVSSLHSICGSLNDSHSAEVYAAIDRGMHVIQSLVCGEETSQFDKIVVDKKQYNKANYASAANSFFDYLSKSLFVIDKNDKDSTAEHEAVRSFLSSQWQQWCIRCEELAYTRENTSSFSGGGGCHVASACFKGYASVCFCSNSLNKFAQNLVENSSGSMYLSLKQTTSRKLWIRVCVAIVVDTIKERAEKRENLSGQNIASDPADVTNSKPTDFDKLFVDSLSPLFHACILKARPKEEHQQSKIVQYKHSERQLLLQEILRACSLLLRERKEGHNSLSNQIAQMVLYLASSLHSYIGQICMGYFQGDQTTNSDSMEFAYNWLLGVCDVIQLVQSRYDCKTNHTVMTALSSSFEIIVKNLIPTITSNKNCIPATFQMTSIYSALFQIGSSLPKQNLRKMVDAKLALNFGVLALSLQNDQELMTLCNLVLCIFDCLINEVSDVVSPGDIYVPSPVHTDSFVIASDPHAGLPFASDLLWIGGILCALGNVFRPRSFVKNTSSLKQLGDIIATNAQRIQREQEKNDQSSHLDDYHLLNIFKYTDYECLINTMKSSLTNADKESVLLSKWKRRPLSLSEQYAALLIGLSYFQLSSVARVEGYHNDDPFSFLGSLSARHPRISSRVVPSLVDMTRTFITKVSPEASFRTLKLLSSSAIVSDPHVASLSWVLFCSLTSDSTPPMVRSSVLRILPDMCSSNKKLQNRIHSLIGKSLTSKDPMIRTAAMASLCDLAEKDLLRDIEEIVGWIQVGLKDEETAVSYFALISLKHLVSNDDLDFDLVMRVLEKRLAIDMRDMSHLLSVLGDDLVLEGFIMLLAEAGFDQKEEGSDEEVDSHESPCVSTKSVDAVNLLISLGLSSEYSLGLHGSSSNICIKLSILRSLACLNAKLLGLDAEFIRTWNAADASDHDIIATKKRYEEIKHIALMGLELVSDASSLSDIAGESVTNTAVENVTSIMTTLLKFEEDAHGSSLYRGSIIKEQTKEKDKKDNRVRVSKTALASLPECETILQMYYNDPTVSTATAAMSSFTDGNLSTEILLSQMSDMFGDIASERLPDPYMQAIQINALMSYMETLQRSIAQEPKQQEIFSMILAEIQNWVNTIGEYAYVALTMFSVQADTGADLQLEFANKVITIHDEIIEGSETPIFDSEETKLLCLTLVASKLSASADARVAEIIDRLDTYFGNTGEHVPFGVIFGMSTLLNHLTQDGNLSRSDPSDNWRRKQAHRIISLYLSSLNSCLTISSPFVESLASCNLDETCFKTEKELSVKESSILTMKGLMIGLGKSFQSITTLNNDLSSCILSIIGALPWKSGKAFALPGAYKACIDAGIRDQNDLSNEIQAILSLHACSLDDPCLGHMIYALVSLTQLQSQSSNTEPDTVLIKRSILDIMNPGRDITGDRKQMAILSTLSLVGEVRGLFSLSSGIHQYTKKDLVVSTTEFLKGVAFDNDEDSKTKDAAVIALGLLSGMKTSNTNTKKIIGNTKNHLTVNFSEIFQGKEDTIMLSILSKINASHSVVTSSAYGDVKRTLATKTLSVLFSSLKAVALPGNISRIIEVTLNDCNNDETELKTSCVQLLVSQLESRRRVGFDGRGFLDLYTRLFKLSPLTLHKLVGPNNAAILMVAVSDVIPQLPTSSIEDTLTNLWTVCQYDLATSFYAQSVIEFFTGLKSILVSARTSATKNVVSPAILRCIQKLVTSTFFWDMCKYAGPTFKEQGATSVSETLWISYTECIREISDSTALSEYKVDKDNVFGIATCSVVVNESFKVSRKVEVYVSRHSWCDTDLETNRRLLLTSLVALGSHYTDISAIQTSIWSMLDLMLVKGIDTMGLEWISILVAYWWDSQQMTRLDLLDTPFVQVSTHSSFLLTSRLCFQMQAWSMDLIIKFMTMCIADLPPKLAVLCQMWKISEDVSNKVSRILASCDEGDGTSPTDEIRQTNSILCLKRILQFLNGGEP